MWLVDRTYGKRAGNNMEPKDDAIVDIPKERLSFFGGAGKMLLPSPTTVAALIEKMPEGKLITTSLICQKLAQQFNVRGTCPVTTQKALQAIAHDPGNKVAYWRVVKANGDLSTGFPAARKVRRNACEKRASRSIGRGRRQR